METVILKGGKKNALTNLYLKGGSTGKNRLIFLKWAIRENFMEGATFEVLA